MDQENADITRLLHQLAQGDKNAETELIPLVYEQLRRLARAVLRTERQGHSLQPTALVHEAYLRIAGEGSPNWNNRSHFFAVAAKMMRRILVDHARSLNAEKRKGIRVPLDATVVIGSTPSAEILLLDDALDRLASWDDRQCRVVELRFFSGLTEEEIALILGVSVRTVKRDWSMAKAWLYGELVTVDEPRNLGMA